MSLVTSSGWTQQQVTVPQRVSFTTAMLLFELQEIRGVADSKSCFSCNTRHFSVASLQLANSIAINHLSFPPV